MQHVSSRIQRRRLGAAQRLGQFEVAARGGSRPMYSVSFSTFRLRTCRSCWAWRPHEQAGAPHALVSESRTETVEARDIELVAQALRARRDVECHAGTRLLAPRRHGIGRAVRRQDLGRPDAFERGRELVGFDFGEPQCAAGEVQPCKADVHRDAALVVARASRAGKRRSCRSSAASVSVPGVTRARPCARRALRRGGIADLLADRDRSPIFTSFADTARPRDAVRRPS